MTSDEVVLERISVPANASRFMQTRQAALEQPLAEIQLSWSETDPYLYNSFFDPAKIAHDESYCTSVVDIDRLVQVPTIAYIDQVLGSLPENPTVVDIGCGQGEFVELLRHRSVEAIGFDPVLREEKAHLHRRYWQPGDACADLFVLRCVLPHIDQPWDFLNSLADYHPEALVLIEFQRLEWILERGIWYQVSHDHVNLFSVDDFTARYDLMDQGVFSGGEWAWILFKASSFRAAADRACPFVPEISSMLDLRRRTLDHLAHEDGPIALWGASGKGIVLSHALVRTGVDVIAIDADPKRHGLFMEASGVRVESPDHALSRLARNSTILVCNPNHLEQIRARHDATHSFTTTSELMSWPSPTDTPRTVR